MITPVATPASTAERPTGRSFLLDLLKAVGCVLIVLHHLAFYGPMSDVVHRVWPSLIGWFSEYARLAVQLFLVCSGYLTASALAARPEMDGAGVLRLAGQRYLRLAIPLMGALSVVVLVTEWIRPTFDHPSLSDTPDVWSTLAHVFFLQDLTGQQALSAGVWYVAIDLQLYVLTLLVMWGASLSARANSLCRPDVMRVLLMLGLTLLSLVYWNRRSELEDHGVYFLGAYGLGWLAHWVRQSRTPLKAGLLLLALGLLALWVEPRWRIAIALGVALLLAAMPTCGLAPAVAHGWRAAVSQLARISYAVFLIHFAVSLPVNAVVTAHRPDSVAWNAAGMLTSLGLSVLAGVMLYRLTEQPRQNLRQYLIWVGLFMASAALAMHMNGSA